MRRFFSSDTHLGEDRFEIMQRPFQTVEQHVEEIVARWNSKVGIDDLTYLIGDALYQKANPEVFLPVLGRMNGRKILIRGNHDVPFSDEQFAPYFEQIIENGGGIDLEVAGIPCYLTHYPTCGHPSKFNLVGHIHSAFKTQLNMLNVGVDVHHFYPVSEDQVKFHFNAISNFYDNDVWVAYNPINAEFVGKRGKQSSYFMKS